MGVRAVPDWAKLELSIDFDYRRENVRSARARRRREATAPTGRQDFCPTALCNFPSPDLLHARVVVNISLFQCVMWLTNREPQLSKLLPSELGSRKAALPTRIERSGKHSEDTITQVWFPERKIDIKIYAAEDESRRRRPVPRRCLSLGRFVLLAVTVEARWISSTRSVFPRNDSYQAPPLKLRLYKKKASIGRIGHDRIGHDRLPMVPANRR
jgi:hypothetical protein